MAADLTRSVAGGDPWLLLEHSTSGVNWQPRNPAKAPGQMARNSLAHLARGSEGALFFQWRQSRRGAEKFHSAMLPHGGTDTRVWREVVELGADIRSLSAIRGTRTRADAAVLWDWQSWWAQNLPWRPSEDHDPRERADTFYEALYDRDLTVDFAHPEADLSAYPLVVVPALYLMTQAAGNNLKEYVERGGTLVVSYFSGFVDEPDAVHEGPCPGALREVLGLTVEEFSPLLKDQRIRVTGPDDAELTGDVWTEFVVPRGAETMWTYADGPAAGHPAVTRHRLGAGTAWYVSTASRYGKPVFVAETAYPFRLDSDDFLTNQIDTTGELVAGYPATPAGQVAWLRDVMNIVEAVPNGCGLGVFSWEATWTAVPGNGWDPTDPSSGNGWENQALFGYDDRALPEMNWFGHR